MCTLKSGLGGGGGVQQPQKKYLHEKLVFLWGAEGRPSGYIEIEKLACIEGGGGGSGYYTEFLLVSINDVRKKNCPGCNSCCANGIDFSCQVGKCF